MYFLLDFYWQILTNTSMLLLVEWKSTEKQDLLHNVRMPLQATEPVVFKRLHISSAQTRVPEPHPVSMQFSSSK